MHMVTLKQAVKLLDMREDEIIHMRLQGQNSGLCPCYSVKQIKEKFDMKHTYVLKIDPYYYLYSNEVNWEFTIKQNKKNKQGGKTI